MKSIAAAFLFAALAAAASAVIYRGPEGYRQPKLPQEWRGVVSPSPQSLLDSGEFWVETPEELDAVQAEEAAAAVESAAQASLPFVSATGFATYDPSGDHLMEIMPTTNGAPALSIQITDSPLDPEHRAEKMAAGKAKWKADFEAAVAGRNGQLPQRIENLERLMGVRE